MVCSTSYASEILDVMSDEDLVLLVNYIRELEDDVSRLEGVVLKLEQALEFERRINADLKAHTDQIINLQKEQIADLKILYKSSKPSIFEKSRYALGGAGIAALLFLLLK